MSLLRFAKDFARLKSDIASQPVPDLQLLCLVDFWSSFADHASEKSFRSYLDEYVPLLSHLISTENLSDLTLDELLRMRETLNDLSAIKSVNDKLESRRKLVLRELARRYFYVGAVEDALTICAEMSDGDSQLEPPWAADVPVCPETVGQAHLELEDPDKSQTPSEFDLQYLSEFEAFESILSWAADLPVCPELNELNAFLKDFHDDWTGDRDAIYHDRINALFVDKDNTGRAWRGRMKSLTGEVELFDKSATTDEITFDNQIKSPDDPFIGAAYHSLGAVRQLMKRSRFKKQSELFYHAHFGVEDSLQTFTGDSIGLATGLLTYAQLLKPEIMRQNKFIGADIAVTGGMDDSGAVTSVNEATLKLKIERAFFSPVRYIVVPDRNLSAAREYIEKLREKYPRRRLRLIGVETLTDAIENRNIIREEKVCIGEFVAKKAYSYSRTAKLQIPILLVLAYFLLCMIYPKAWVGFDYHIDHLEIVGNYFKAINPDGHLIFTSGEFNWQLNGDAYNGSKKFNGHKFHAVGDFDGDGHSELYFVPVRQGTGAGTHSVYYYCGGKLIDSLKCFKQTKYPGDNRNAGYTLQDISLITDDLGRVFLLTRADCSMPMRSQLMLWETMTHEIVSGPYLHTGGFWTTLSNLFDFDFDGYKELVLGGSNNRLDMASLLVIDPMKMGGVSPPYDDQHFIASRMSKGSQLYYYAFPETPMSADKGIRNYVYQVDPAATETSVVVIRVREGLGINEAQYDRNPVILFYFFDQLITPATVGFGDVDYPNLRLNCELLGYPLTTTQQELLDRLLNNIIVYRDTQIIYPKDKSVF